MGQIVNQPKIEAAWIQISETERAALNRAHELACWAKDFVFSAVTSRAPDDLVDASSRLCEATHLGSDTATAAAVLRDVATLRSLDALLDWYAKTHLAEGPVRNATEIGSIRSCCSSLAHRLITHDGLSKLLDVSGSIDPELSRIIRLQITRKKKIPAELVADLARLESVGEATWQKAREAKDFCLVAPILKEIVEKRRSYASCLGFGNSLYDSLLDEYDQGSRTALIDPILQDLRIKIQAILAERKVSNVSPSLPQTNHSSAVNLNLAREALEEIGYKLEHGRIDLSTHPFCCSISAPDLVVLTVGKDDTPVENLSSALHEGGHAVFGQGLNPIIRGTTVGSDISLAIDEGMSKFFECIIGRGRPFWQSFYPKLQAAVPEFSALSLDQFLTALNKIAPHPVRLQSDELTYNLHIILRYEIERDLINGKIEVDDLPKVWNSKVKEYLGVTPPDDLDGVLQDTHWYCTMLGYFPCYSVGNLISAQLYATALEEIPDLEAKIADGEASILTDWLREKVFKFGGFKAWPEIIKAATGKDLSADAYISLMRERYLR